MARGDTGDVCHALSSAAQHHLGGSGSTCRSTIKDLLAAPEAHTLRERLRKLTVVDTQLTPTAALVSVRFGAGGGSGQAKLVPEHGTWKVAEFSLPSNPNTPNG